MRVLTHSKALDPEGLATTLIARHLASYRQVG
jgi:hypothetical protein